MKKPVNLILGTMTFGESVFSPDVESFIHTFLDAGYDELDTAYVYNDGNCERLLGEVLPKLDRPFKIATKVNPRISGRLDADAAYKTVMLRIYTAHASISAGEHPASAHRIIMNGIASIEAMKPAKCVAALIGSFTRKR